MRTKAKDRIQFPDGRIMTLSEAIDIGAVTLKVESNYRTGKPMYLAEITNGDQAWDIGKTLYESRTGLKPFTA